MTTRITLLTATIAGTAACCFAATPDLSKLPPPSGKTGLTYEKDIKPIFETTCFRCHGEERHRGGLRLDSLPAALQGGEDGKVVLPGKSTESPLVIAVAQLDDETAMPPKRGPGGGPGGPGGGRGGFGPGMMLAPQMVAQADKDGDKKLTETEFTALADTWFDKLDPDKSDKLSQEQFTTKLSDVLQPPQGRGGPGGAAPNAQRPGNGRGGFSPARFIGPGLFSAADNNKDGSLTRSELKATFTKWYRDWDAEKSGSLAEAKIRDGLNAVLPRPNFGGGPGGNGPGNRGGGPGGPGGGPGPGPQSKPLTAEQVGLVRAWIDQGAK